MTVTKPRLLDLFCGAGGAAMGYARAGFDVVGVDINPQPRYPFEFHQADAMTYPLDGFDVIHASPPCQAYSQLTPLTHRANHPMLIVETRLYLRQSRAMYVIENVPGARSELLSPLMLCGTMFGLPLWRHRYFEIGSEVAMRAPASCAHSRRPVLVGAGTPHAGYPGPVSPSGTTRRKAGRFEWSSQEVALAMEIDWMTRAGLDQSFPPAYTEWIGRQLIAALLHEEEAVANDAVHDDCG